MAIPDLRRSLDRRICVIYSACMATSTKTIISFRADELDIRILGAVRKALGSGATVSDALKFAVRHYSTFKNRTPEEIQALQKLDEIRELLGDDSPKLILDQLCYAQENP